MPVPYSAGAPRPHCDPDPTGTCVPGAGSPNNGGGANVFCGCLSSETKVEVYQGKPTGAADIHVGDKLVSAEGCPELVVSATKSIQPLMRFSWRGGEIVVSRSHHFLDSAGAEAVAETLELGDEILGANSEPCKITGIEEAGEGEVVLLSCRPTHVYRAAGLLHHNKAQPHAYPQAAL